MSDEIDDGGELSAEAKAFLSRHAATGEPSAEALERVRQRLSAPKADATLRRSFLRSEVMAAAAVVILLLGAQGLYLALRAPVEEVKLDGSDGEVKAIAEAWRSGDFERVERLASQECSSAACRPLASEVAKMLGLAQHVETLSEDERSQLATFDKKLTGKTLSKVAIQLLKLKAPEAPSAAAVQLFEEAQAEKKAKNFERAAVLLEQCIALAPSYSPCYRFLGSTYASLATRDQSASDMEKARKYYELFVQVAEADDEYLPKVQAILDAAASKPAPVDSAQPESGSLPMQVTLAVGNQTEVELKANLQRVAVGDPAVADIKVSGPRKLLVIGVGEGSTTLLVWLENGERASTVVKVSGGRVGVTDFLIEGRIEKRFSQATKARKAGDLPLAVKLALSIRQRDPAHAGAKEILEQGRSEARDAYLRGYQLRETSPEEAVRMFKRVLSLTAPEDETHQKAKVRLRELEP